MNFYIFARRLASSATARGISVSIASPTGFHPSKVVALVGLPLALDPKSTEPPGSVLSESAFERSSISLLLINFRSLAALLTLSEISAKVFDGHVSPSP